MTLGQVHYPTNGNKRRALTTPARLSSSIFFFLGLSSETFSNYLFQSTPREALVQDSNTKIKRTFRVRAQTALHFHLSERQKLTISTLAYAPSIATLLVSLVYPQGLCRAWRGWYQQNGGDENCIWELLVQETAERLCLTMPLPVRGQSPLATSWGCSRWRPARDLPTT